MKIDHPDKRIINSIKKAVEWFKETEIHNIRVERIKAPKIVLNTVHLLQIKLL